jgi:uncharacterized protein YraI
MDTAVIWRATSLAEDLNVRTGPGTEYPVSYQLYAGEPVMVVEESGNWCRVDNGWWVFANFLARVG